MKFFFLFFTFFVYSNSLYSEENKPFLAGKIFYELKNFSKSKLEFEKSIVLDPKKTNSYIYLSKIYSETKNTEEEKKNLQTAILLEPKNEEALYLLSLFNIKEGDFKSLEKNYSILSKNCYKFCNKLSSIVSAIEKFKKK
jgi:tetratricopeptide (TPR) repeat protein